MSPIFSVCSVISVARIFLDLLSMGLVDEDRDWNFEKVK